MAALAFVGLLASLLVSSVVNGWALSVLWGWFFVPTLDLPSINIVQAVGISIVISFLTTRRAPDKDDESKGVWEKTGEAFVWAIFYPLLAVGIGWIVHLFM